MKKYKIAFVFILFLTTIICCVEPFDIKSLEYENFLVVEATITNENKKQEIKLSRTFEVDSLGPRPEVSANVFLLDDNKTKYNFIEESNGLYTSNIIIDKNKTYILKIETTDGESYSSSPEKLTNASEIDEVTFSNQINNVGESGVSINISSSNPNNDSKYYRFKYEETYKIIAPYWSQYSLEVTSRILPYSVKKVKKTVDNRVCYKTDFSKEILLTENSLSSDDRVVNFPVKFINISDFTLSHRYSILVKQYVQTVYSYNYFKTLKDFSSTESFFTQVQSGFLQGNLTSESNTKNKVVGFFEISAVSKKRIFFNREDISKFSATYVDNCEYIAPLLFDPFALFSPLIYTLGNNYTLYQDNDLGLEHLEGPYLLVKRVCGDCTILGTNQKPSFWID